MSSSSGGHFGMHPSPPIKGHPAGRPAGGPSSGQDGIEAIREGPEGPEGPNRPPECHSVTFRDPDRGPIRWDDAALHLSPMAAG